MKPIAYIMALLCLTLTLTGCKDKFEDEPKDDFSDNWKDRNDAFFAETMATAREAIAQAQAEYGDDWQSHTPWRLFISYAKMPSYALLTDSIIVKVKKQGTGPGCPLFTDSVKVNYRGHVMPTDNYSFDDGVGGKVGRVFDHSGLYESDDYVFNETLATPTRFMVSNMVEGYTTVLQHMHVGDRWLVYIPRQLGYDGGSSGVLPAYSTLIFDTELKAYWR